MKEKKKSSGRSIEAYGNSVEEAIQNALKELNVPREAISVKVVSEEKKGLFGMQGEKPAKIIVTLNE